VVFLGRSRPHLGDARPASCVAHASVPDSVNRWLGRVVSAGPNCGATRRAEALSLAYPKSSKRLEQAACWTTAPPWSIFKPQAGRRTRYSSLTTVCVTGPRADRALRAPACRFLRDIETASYFAAGAAGSSFAKVIAPLRSYRHLAGLLCVHWYKPTSLPSFSSNFQRRGSPPSAGKKRYRLILLPSTSPATPFGYPEFFHLL